MSIYTTGVFYLKLKYREQRYDLKVGKPFPGERGRVGVLPINGLMGMCLWMGSYFHI